MNTQTKPFDAIYLTGIVLIAVSMLLFCMPVYMRVDEAANLGLFGLSYLLTVLYLILIWSKGRLRKGREGLPLIFVLLVLALISAWSLNRTMCVFERSVPWLTAVQVVCAVCFLSLRFLAKMPVWCKYFVAFILGFSFVLFLYLAIYLVQIYPVSMLLSIGLGLSLHSFVPALLVLFIIRQCYRIVKAEKRYLPAMAAGVITPLVIAVIFTLSWARLNDMVKDEFQNSLIADNTDLPAWIHIAQTLPNNSLTEKYLKGDIVYSLPSKAWGWGMPSRNYDEARKHDPLVMFAAIFSRPPAISEADRIRILKAMYDARHKTLNRLWAGDQLVTDAVISNVRIWPESRIAYTEKTITVFCDEPARSWPAQREGIYTFYLPEGGVVTSLSLWINGREEKARLTTKSKADSAYKTIVGVESRDPSVVHWQEGNTVSVRVFPVLSAQSRVFKIGITAPLKAVGKELVYENIYFRGPDASWADETIQVDWATMPPQMKMPEGFTVNAGNRFIKKTHYDPSWQLRFNDPGIVKGSFSFDGYTYNIAPYKPGTAPATFSRVYLDINSSWSQAEVNEVLQLTKGMQAYVYSDGMVQLNEETKPLLEILMQRNFSMLPFYEIGDYQGSLVITKGKSSSPDLSDLAGCDFAKKLEAVLGKGVRYNVYCLNGQLSPYLKTLKEHRVFNYGQGNAADLRQLLNSNSFPASIESDSLVVINDAGITLSKTAGSVASTAPDHLMRLFAYNHIMQQLGANVFTGQEANDTLVTEAAQAYIVTPASSLVVLETRKDYDRFGIQQSKNSLQNATLKANGAVPEPEEWALMIFAAGTLIWVFYRTRAKKSFL